VKAQLRWIEVGNQTERTAQFSHGPTHFGSVRWQHLGDGDGRQQKFLFNPEKTRAFGAEDVTGIAKRQLFEKDRL